jgi:hypothetical protein
MPSLRVLKACQPWEVRRKIRQISPWEKSSEELPTLGYLALADLCSQQKRTA